MTRINEATRTAIGSNTEALLDKPAAAPGGRSIKRENPEMNGMFALRAADLHQLKGAGGERFAQFADRLIRAEAARGGLAQSEILTQLRVNIADGGVDTQVKEAIPADPTGWFNVPTCWQFKAEEGTDISDGDLSAEIRKPYVKQLLSGDTGIVFVCLGT